MPKRPADIFAGEGSVAGRLLAGRKAHEKGDPMKARAAMKKPAKKKKSKPKQKKSEAKRKSLRSILLSKPAKDKRDPMRRGQ